MPISWDKLFVIWNQINEYVITQAYSAWNDVKYNDSFYILPLNLH